MMAEVSAMEQAECNSDVGLCQDGLILPRLVEA